jgi:hypothetical protein
MSLSVYVDSALRFAEMKTKPCWCSTGTFSLHRAEGKFDIVELGESQP